MKKLLIIDDSEVDRNLLAAAMKKKGFDTITLGSGEGCLEAVRMKKPAAVLLDILMPNVHGKQVVHLLREKYSSIELPIIMVTIKSDASDVIESLQLGANDYITKPVDFDVAAMRVQTQLHISELSQYVARMKEIEALQGIVATYNHEINNPLAIALGAVKVIEEVGGAKVTTPLKKLEGALWKVADIVKRIEETSRKCTVEYERYDHHEAKMVKVK